MKTNIYVVYEVINRINGIRYIGKTNKNRLLNGYRGSGSAIRKAHKEYGLNNFDFNILSEHSIESEAYKEETRLIRQFNAVDSLEYYNLMVGDYSDNSGWSVWWKKMKLEYGENLSSILSNRMKRIYSEHPEYGIARSYRMKGIGNPKFGKFGVDNKNTGQHYQSAEFRNNCSKWMMKAAEDERIFRYSKNLKLYGMKITPETASKISKSQKTELNPKSVPILCTNVLTGETIRYPSMRQAGQDSGIGHVKIRSILRGLEPQRDDYIFQYASNKVTTGGVQFNENTAKKISQSMKGKSHRISNPTKTSKILSENRKNGKWVNKEGVRRFVKEPDFNRLLLEGWSSGIGKQKKK